VSPLTSHGFFLHRMVRKQGMLLLGTRVVEVDSEGVLVRAKDGEKHLGADTVVWAVGSVPETSFGEVCREVGITMMTAGDALEPRRLLDAVHEGYKAAYGLLYGAEA
jgi:hypothetical protein